MPTHTVNFDPEQYNYLYSTSDENEMSERAREIFYLGMWLEQSDFDETAEILRNEHDEWSPDAQEAINHIVDEFIERHE